jgi:hypothetical protein
MAKFNRPKPRICRLCNKVYNATEANPGACGDMPWLERG